MVRCSSRTIGLEYRVQISEWLLHSSKDDYLFSPTDKDAHAPLLIHITPQHFSAADLRATQRAETKVDRNARRKERQKTRRRQLVALRHLPVALRLQRLRLNQRLPPTRASPKVTRAARRARRGTSTTARAKARSERGLRRMLKSFSGISNRGPSQSVFTAPRGCEYLYSVPRLPCSVECLWKAHRCMRNPIVLQRSYKRSPNF